ncbi:hypothetical protein AVEN_241257-1 [Araneus ventricosus]|uniref:Secreted protein n=1 Tax=Araneus ventricosus TaxID=182803 RepID=A0A4Y2PAY3_ARAVE|nr:hypothetical protein AVEN_241257-1 [Araneus ventricosus]
MLASVWVILFPRTVQECCWQRAKTSAHPENSRFAILVGADLKDGLTQCFWTAKRHLLRFQSLKRFHNITLARADQRTWGKHNKGLGCLIWVGRQVRRCRFTDMGRKTGTSLRNNVGETCSRCHRSDELGPTGVDMWVMNEIGGLERCQMGRMGIYLKHTNKKKTLLTVVTNTQRTKVITNKKNALKKAKRWNKRIHTS